MKPAHEYRRLSLRLNGLRRQGQTTPLTIGYELTATWNGEETIALAYRGTRFAILTPESVTVWHNHSNISATFQRHLNSVLRPMGHAVIRRDGEAYLSNGSSTLTPFPSSIPVTLLHYKETASTPREG